VLGGLIEGIAFSVFVSASCAKFANEESEIFCIAGKVSMVDFELVPCFHVSFGPDLTQVNFIELTTDLCPTFVQLFPEAGVAALTLLTVEPSKNVATNNERADLRIN
jgi:hypothetical protein